MIAVGSNSSAIFTFIILVVVMLMGGVPFKDLLLTGAAVVVLCGAGYGLHKATDGKFMPRIQTLISRVGANYDTEVLEGLKPRSQEFYNALDKIRQPYGAKVAIHEGKGIIWGKGIGNSTQKYSVTHIYSDYMFSFIIEEYGIWGAFIVIMLYVSLLARGSMIARLCDNEFAKVAVGGLSILITGQAFMHMFVNVDIGPMTGQTLPLISHGSSAFLMFSIAFGIILSISRMTREKIKEEEEAATPIYQREQDEIQATLEDIERLEEI
jgi:cell division protein FtsW